MTFSAAEIEACRRLVALALQEDLDGAGDVTSQATIPADLSGSAVFVARSPGVIAGLPAVALVLNAVDPRLTLESAIQDGQTVKSGQRLATVSGPVRSLLTAERTALNFLQQLSGVASLTARYVQKVTGLSCKILDTRKTIPGWRLLQKYAVRCGGGHNHRMGLFDGILIKDNHLEAGWFQGPKPVRRAVEAARQLLGHAMPVEVEVDDLEEFDEALQSDPAIVLLDNMTLDQLQQAVRRRNERAPNVRLEASGGVNLETVRGIAETGVDCISIGALTHSAPALDIALDYSEP